MPKGVYIRKPRKKSAPWERFWNKVSKSEGCWVWIGAKVSSAPNQAYGLLRVGGRPGYNVLAHRVSYEMHIGAIPVGSCVLHKCDNPSCVRPDHLFLGTRGDNIRDAVSKGRWGQRGRPNKLTREKVREIRKLLKVGVLQYSVAERFGVVPSVISAINTGRIWRSVVND